MARGPNVPFNILRFISHISQTVTEAMTWQWIPHGYYEQYCKLSTYVVSGYDMLSKFFGKPLIYFHGHECSYVRNMLETNKHHLYGQYHQLKTLIS